MWERSGGGTISLGYCSVLSARKVCLKTVPMPLATAHTGEERRSGVVSSLTPAPPRGAHRAAA